MMQLRKLSIENYKSFFETTALEFGPGFNVLMGANSSGKTSVLEAIETARLTNRPHRSMINVTEPGAKSRANSVITTYFSVSREELLRMYSPHQNIFVAFGNGANVSAIPNLPALNVRLRTEGLFLDFRRDFSQEVVGRLQLGNLDSAWRALGGTTQFPAANLSLQTGEFSDPSNYSTGAEELSTLWGQIATLTYRFSADRKVRGSFGHHPNDVLLPNAENLAYCLNRLQTSNPNLYDHLIDSLQRVFPTIHLVGAPPDSNGASSFELMVHSVPKTKNRGDLAVPIEQVGTGVFNALAILYVVMTAQTSHIILLEEPNSFLHPRAVRELLAILAEAGSKHQFFITTHSSDVLRTINASTVSLLENDGQITSAKQTAGNTIVELRSGLIDLGIRLTDLHGCDRVLWVEGETEVAVFPLLLRKFMPSLAQGVAVLPLFATGDFESRRIHPDKVAEIYRRLSQASFLAPPMVAIALDRERKTEQKVKLIEDSCEGLVKFLPKPMLEDYLLNEEAISDVINKSFESNVTSDEIAKALAVAPDNPELLLNRNNPNSVQIHAANTLATIFRNFGGAGAEYKKTDHGPKLATWILKNKPEHFNGLRQWLVEVFS